MLLFYPFRELSAYTLGIFILGIRIIIIIIIIITARRRMLGGRLISIRKQYVIR